MGGAAAAAVDTALASRAELADDRLGVNGRDLEGGSESADDDGVFETVGAVSDHSRLVTRGGDVIEAGGLARRTDDPVSGEPHLG